MPKKTPEYVPHEDFTGQSQNIFMHQNPQFSGQHPYIQGVPQISFGLCYDIIEEGDSLIILAPFPGLIRDTLEVIQENGWLHVRGQTEIIAPEMTGSSIQRNVLLNQIPNGTFEQTIALPIDVKQDSTSAVFSNGILTITLKKAISKNLSKVNVSFK